MALVGLFGRSYRGLACVSGGFESRGCDHRGLMVMWHGLAWRACPGGATGRRGPLKTGCPNRHVGSSPTPGTQFMFMVLTQVNGPDFSGGS